MASPPITISSSNDVITIMSSDDEGESTIRVPVSEERADNSSDQITNEKVNNWLADPRNAHTEYTADTLNVLKMHDYCIRKEQISHKDEKSNTLVVKCDFEKNTSVVVNDSPLRIKQAVTTTKSATRSPGSLEALLGRALGNIFSRSDDENGVKRGDKLVKRKFKIRNICFKYNTAPKVNKDDTKGTTMSPESQKKKELCTYLKLMNPADKKENVNTVANSRRCSTRVKRALERKSVEPNEPEDFEKFPTLQSFDDLNIKVDKKSLLSYKKVFQFPAAPQHFLDKIEHFDDVVGQFMDEPKRSKVVEKKSTLKKVVRILRKKKNMNKENIKEHQRNWKRRRELKNRKLEIRKKVDKKRELVRRRLMTNTLDSFRALRSRSNLKHVNLRRVLSRKGTDSAKSKIKPKRKLPKTDTERTVVSDLEKNRKQNSESSKKAGKKQSEEKEPPKREETSQREEEEEEIAENEHKTKTEEKESTNQTGKSTENEEPSQKEERTAPSIAPEIHQPVETIEKPPEEVMETRTEAKQTIETPNCEIISIPEAEEDDEERINDELSKLDILSDVHRRELVQNCILSPKHDQIVHLSTGRMSPMLGFNAADIEHVQNVCTVYKKYIDSDSDATEANEERIEAADSTVMECNTNIPDHDYLNENDDDDEDSEDEESVEEEDTNKFIIPKMSYEEFSPPPQTDVEESPTNFQPFNGEKIMSKSLHRNLMQAKRKHTTYWNGLTKKSYQTTIAAPTSHSIYINRENGPVLNAFYIDYKLIMCQEYVVSFWEQSPLGNILNAQNMWLPKGHIQRLMFNNKYVQKKSREMVVSMETSVALVELWTKEHKSEMRERPVADVFATVYFWKHGQTGLDKKVIQLENIKGFAEDVQYVVSQQSPKIIVSWNSSDEDKRTHIHAYQLASDYQTVANIYEIQPVTHYISSLHNIEDCNYLIMGCGENRITVWNIDYGNILASIELSTIQSPLATLWVKSDRGFLFTIQECENNELRLIAINGLNHSWKRLASYNSPSEFNRLKGVYFDEGILVSFSDKDILCWKVENGERIVQETFNGTEIIPSGKYVIMINNNQVIVRNTITYLYIE